MVCSLVSSVVAGQKPQLVMRRGCAEGIGSFCGHSGGLRAGGLEMGTHPYPAKLFHLLSPGLWTVTDFSGPRSHLCPHGDTNRVREPLRRISE